MNEINQIRVTLELNSHLKHLSLSDTDYFFGGQGASVEEQSQLNTFPKPHSIEAMEVDGVSSEQRLTPPKEFCDSPNHNQSDTSMNFDYLGRIMEPRQDSYGYVDDRHTIDRCLFLITNKKLFF